MRRPNGDGVVPSRTGSATARPAVRGTDQAADLKHYRSNRHEPGRLSAHRLRTLLNRFQWFHQIIGVLGGFTFFTGSIFFLFGYAWQTAAIWLFIIGSAGMLIGNIGSVIVRYKVDNSGHHDSVADRKPTEPIG